MGAEHDWPRRASEACLKQRSIRHPFDNRAYVAFTTSRVLAQPCTSPPELVRCSELSEAWQMRLASTTARMMVGLRYQNGMSTSNTSMDWTMFPLDVAAAPKPRSVDVSYHKPVPGSISDGPPSHQLFIPRTSCSRVWDVVSTSNSGAFGVTPTISFGRLRPFDASGDAFCQLYYVLFRGGNEQNGT